MAKKGRVQFKFVDTTTVKKAKKGKAKKKAATKIKVKPKIKTKKVVKKSAVKIKPKKVETKKPLKPIVKPIKAAKPVSMPIKAGKAVDLPKLETKFLEPKVAEAVKAAPLATPVGKKVSAVKPKSVKKVKTKAKIKTKKPQPKKEEESYLKTEIKGLDELLVRGVPKGVSVLIAGGAGSGKTLMCLQMLNNFAKQGKKCLYMSFEESVERLNAHMKEFGWAADELEKKNLLRITRYSPFDINRYVDALLAKERKELLIDVEPVIFPKGFKPDVVIVDSLSAIAAGFVGRESTYREYINQLFRFFESLKINSFLITETEEIPNVYSRSGVEEFLADGVFVLYNLRKGGVRENAVEILKMRGTPHLKKIVAMRIVSKVGVEIYPEQEVFTKI